MRVGLGVGWGAIVSRYRVLFWGDERLLEMEDGEGWIIVGMSFLPPNT